MRISNLEVDTKYCLLDGKRFRIKSVRSNHERIAIPTITKTKDRKVYRYFIKLNCATQRKLLFGFMYFTYDEENKSSAFYGVRVNDKYRNMGISDFLISNWIDFCLQNGVETLYTIDKQRKPLLIYSLKKQSFELEKSGLYIKEKGILICNKKDGGMKALCFPDDESEREFRESSINKTTPHLIIPEITSEYEPIEIVLLNHAYYAKDLDKAYRVSRQTIDGFQEKLDTSIELKRKSSRGIQKKIGDGKK